MTATRALVRAPELAELRAFCMAVELASIGRAAQQLHVSQPALSKRLRTLEAVAGTRLLERSTRGVAPTESGSALYREARRLLSEAEAVEALMRGFLAEEPPVRIAASPTLVECWLPQALVAFETKHERRLAVELVAANSARVRAMVRERGADLGLAAVDGATAPDERLSEVIVCEDEIVVAVPPDHPWAALEEVAPEQLAQTPTIQRDPGAHSARSVAAALAARGLSPVPPLAQIGSTSAARAAALAEGAPLLVSRMALCEDDGALVVRRIAGTDLRRRFALLRRADGRAAAPAVAALARHLLAPAA